MNLKNINKFLLIFIFLFFLSCQSSKKEIILLDSDEIIEANETISNKLNYHDRYYTDYYSLKFNYNWQNNKNLQKKMVINNPIKNDLYLMPISNLIYDNKIYFIDHNYNLNVYGLNEEKKIDSFKINVDIKNEFSYPTSIAMVNNLFYASFSDGTLINFDTEGNIIWHKFFDDILKTPIKIYNNDIIIITSDKVFSINLISGNENWKFLYQQENTLNALGGKILAKNHLLFFILPNNRLREIDTFIGEKNISFFSNIQLDQSSLNFNYTLHAFDDFISLFENNEYLYTFDNKKNIILINKFNIKNITSHDFINNSLITLNNNNILKAYNISNNKLFWKTNLNDYLDKNTLIIEVINNDNRIIIFFSDGLILEIDNLTGEVLFEQNIKVNNISEIN